MTLADIETRVQAMLDDPDGTYVTADYVAAHAQTQYEALYNKLYNSGSQFDELAVEIPGVTAGIPDLSQYLKDGQPLAMLVRPRMLEWKLPSQDRSFYRAADGPLDRVRDIPSGNNLLGVSSALDSWAWMRRNILLSNFTTSLDIRLTGDFLFDPLIGPDSVVQLAPNCNATLCYMIAAAIAEARGNPGWVATYNAKAVDTFDELFIALTKAEQSKTRRVARMNRRGFNRSSN